MKRRIDLPGRAALQIGFFAVTLAGLSADHVRAQSSPFESSCHPIGGAPTTITSSGHYCLATDIRVLDGSQNGVTVEADNVSIDLEDHQIIGAGTATVTGAGIYAAGVKGLHVAQGQVSGFLFGMRIELHDPSNSVEASDTLIEHMRVQQNTLRGIYALGRGTIVRDSVVSATGGSSVVEDASSIGIEAMGPNCVIEDNAVLETYGVGVGETVGISVSDRPAACKIRRNLVRNTTLPQSGRSMGLWIGGEDRRAAVAILNRVEEYTYAFQFSWRDPPLFERNVFVEIDCTPADLPAYYSDLPSLALNWFIGEREGCSDSIEALRAKTSLNARESYRLAVSYYEMLEAPRDLIASINGARKAVGLFELAASKGLKEAERRLPGARNRLQLLLACRRQDQPNVNCDFKSG